MKISEYYIAPSCSVKQITSLRFVCASDFSQNNVVEDVDIAEEYGW
ncbi:MAG: hypothetical protein J6Y45_05035 [Bacteroidales bacterium]|nr:hypothetical protein [Bacteroidales bacterium]